MVLNIKPRLFKRWTALDSDFFSSTLQKNLGLVNKYANCKKENVIHLGSNQFQQFYENVFLARLTLQHCFAKRQRYGTT